jgi:hypothetical protein
MNVIRFGGCWRPLGHRSERRFVLQGLKVTTAAVAPGQHAPMFEKASLETAKSFVRAPVRATVQPVQSIFPYLQAQASPALSSIVPSLHSCFRSQIVLPIRDPTYSFASESL